MAFLLKLGFVIGSGVLLFLFMSWQILAAMFLGFGISALWDE